jgi:hypothetical protein
MKNDRDQWIVIGLALIVGLTVTFLFDGLFGIGLAVVAGLGLGWGYRHFIAPDDPD